MKETYRSRSRLQNVKNEHTHHPHSSFFPRHVDDFVTEYPKIENENCERCDLTSNLTVLLLLGQVIWKKYKVDYRNINNLSHVKNNSQDDKDLGKGRY